MNIVRGLIVWLGAPLLASSLCTMAWSMTAGGTMANWRVAVSMGFASLIFTIGGSALLSCLFAGMSARPIVRRYFILVGVGAVVGGATMLFLGFSSAGVTAGTIYGVVTGCFWVGLHRAIYRSDSLATGR